MKAHTPKYRRASYPFSPGHDRHSFRHLRDTPAATSCGVFGLLLFVGSIALMLAVQHPEFLPHMGAQDVSTFSSLAMFLLFAWLYGANIAVWERCHVDYIRAFGFNPKTAVHAYEALHLATALSLALACGLAGFVVATTLSGAGGLYYPYSTIIVGVFCTFVLFVVLPVPVFFHETRLFIFRSTWQVLAGPIFYGVSLVHNYLADVLTSTCLALYDFEFDACFIVTGAWLKKTDPSMEVPPCGSGSVNEKWARPIMYALPFWLRFWQCVYKCWENRHKQGWPFWQHVVNAGKYASCLNVVATSVLHGDMDGVTGKYHWSIYRYAWLAAIIIKTTYCYMWDVTMDWDLGKVGRGQHRKYPLLRKSLMYPWTWYYYFAMVTNFFARAAWALAISPRQCPPNWRLSLACVEIFRRGQWSLLRVENEFLQTLTVSPIAPPKRGKHGRPRRSDRRDIPKSPTVRDLTDNFIRTTVDGAGSCNSSRQSHSSGASGRRGGNAKRAASSTGSDEHSPLLANDANRRERAGSAGPSGHDSDGAMPQLEPAPRRGMRGEGGLHDLEEGATPMTV